MSNPNQAALDYCGVSAWHDAGYTGKLGLSATGEQFDPKGTELEGFVEEPFKGLYDNQLEEGHAYQTTYIHHLFAPERTIVQLPYSLDDFKRFSVGYIQKNNVDTMFLSVSSKVNGRAYDEVLNGLPHLSFFSAAGNYGGEKFNQLLYAEGIYGVGAVEIPSMKLPAYSSESNEVDFCGPTGLRVYYANGASVVFQGTSCATPALAGMAACINHLFIEKTGKALRREKMYQFLKDCCRDLGSAGKDPKTGWGLPILPKPEEVDIQNYIEGENAMFTDIEGHWAKSVIEEVVKVGLMNGFPDNTFRPDEPLTRAQAAQMIKNVTEYMLADIDSRMI